MGRILCNDSFFLAFSYPPFFFSLFWGGDRGVEGRGEVDVIAGGGVDTQCGM